MAVSAGIYPSTHWSSVYRAADSEQQAGQGALNALLIRYYPVLLGFVRSKYGLAEDEARDLVQGFVERKILLHNLLRSADPARGRFRGFLRQALDRYIIDQLRFRQCPSRRPSGGTLPIHEGTDSAEHVAAATEANPFDRAWASSVIEQAEQATESFYRAKDRGGTWGVFRDGVLLPLKEGLERPSDEELARRHGFESARQASNAMITVKRQFGRILRQVIRQYVQQDEDVDRELRELMAVLSGP